MADLNDQELKEVLDFLAKWAPDHPELGEGKIIRWQRGFHFISRSRGRIIGFIMQLPQAFRYGKQFTGKEDEQIGWGVTLVVESGPESDRIRSAATHELLTKLERNKPWQFAAIGVVPEIESTYIKRGHQVRRDASKMYARFIHPLPALRYQKKSGLIAPALKLANAFFPAPKSTDNEAVTKIERFDPKWDEEWDRILSKRYELYGVRTAEYLNYKLEQPDRDYKVFIHKDGGYIVYRYAQHRTRDMKLVKICDLVATEKARADLIALAMEYAYETDAYGITAVGAAVDERDYKKAGLYIARPYIVTVPPHIAAQMHVSFFDSDLDNLW